MSTRGNTHDRLERLRRSIENNAVEEFSRSGGPGGQHVNKSNTKVTLKVPLSSLPVQDEERQRVGHMLAGKINAEGEIVIQSSETRSQAENRRRACERAARLIDSALTPKKKRRPTGPSRAAKERRLQKKRRRGEKKRYRKPPPAE